ncbi:MAG: hypothetical protein WEA09_07925 [Gemmatimonadota bacterium]
MLHLPSAMHVAILAAMVVAPGWASPDASAQQQLSVRVEENLRAQPNGTLLGTLEPGARLREGVREGQWSEVTVEGWIWLESLQQRSGTLNLVVSVSGGENLRSQPQGSVMGRLAIGTLLEELERRPGWVRVRRTGWMWRPSLETASVAEASGQTAPQPPPTQSQVGRAPGNQSDVATSNGAWIRIGSRGLPLLAGPGGDTLGVTGPGTEVQVLGRQGNWSRVRLEGWIWTPEGQAGGVESGEATPPEVSAADIVASPDAFLGRVVTLTLQFISLERAERVRTDFYEGEPFLLTRASQGGGGFVYVALPPERLGEVQGIAPLDRIVVTGRVRAGAGTLTGSPILDLQGLRRAPPGSDF